MILHLSTEEKLSLENSALKLNNLQLQSQQLQGSFNQIQAEHNQKLADFCKKNSKKAEEIVNVDFQRGTVEFKDEEKNKEKAVPVKKGKK